MGLFNRIKFSEKSAQKADKVETVNWNTIESSEDLNCLIQASHQKPQALFKHSTRCGISSMVLRSFTHENSSHNENIDFHLLDLIALRSLSDEISERFSVFHQSPQLIVVKEGKVFHHSSHSDINRFDLNELA